ncbi:HAMP domain-containing histidine kinase [Ruminococcaceae bacterium OttesenSCG-928-A16]|nr:HAMP domain-containing histidine kinase [Ruminococcaceae bacterium OttesenSCG-928-A16]
MAKLNKVKKPLSGIKWKTFLFLLGFCVLMLVILWLFQTVFLESFYTSIKLSEVEKQVNSLAALVQNGQQETFETNIKNRGDLHVELVNSNGESQAVDGFFPEFGMDAWNAQQRAALYQQAVANGGTISEQYNEASPPKAALEPGQLPNANPAPQGELTPQPPGGWQGRWSTKSILQGRIVTTPEGQEYLLLVRAVITPVNATVQTLRIQLIYISVIMVALAVGLALLLSGWVAKPIQKLNKAAAQLGKGNYNVNFEGRGYREVAELSYTLNLAAGELAKTEALRRDLIANVSHDLRTPLTLITGYAEMMRDIPGENSPENMQIIIDEAKRLSSLVGDLLDLSQLEAGVSPLRLEKLNLTSSIEMILERFAKFSEAEGYTVQWQNTGGNVCVMADPGRIGQVLYNFLTNALTHAGSGKTIVVRQSMQAGRVKVEVTDDGPGIEQSQLPYIWQRYFKVDKQHKRPVTGAGLGLSIVKNILNQHPGVEYGVESAEGQGSTFWFSLPVVQNQ